MMGLSDYHKSWHTNKYILFMTTFNALAMLLSNLIRVQRKLDNQVYKEMIGQVLWSQLPSDRKNIGLEKQQKKPSYFIMRFMLPNFRNM